MWLRCELRVAAISQEAKLLVVLCKACSLTFSYAALNKLYVSSFRKA